MVPGNASITFANELVKGNDIQCIVEIDNSTYKFTIPAEGFADWYSPTIYEYFKDLIGDDVSLYENQDVIDASVFSTVSEVFAGLEDYEDAQDLSEEYAEKAHELFETR